ncbi:MAG: ImmA/IrrE family metallo-endopeptidase [Bacteroidia bacterium]|nr:ImmA/IrrE family metallo-endopeptidase [Bacteroidia bacterium]
MQNEKLNPKMLTLAREARGYSQADLAELTGVSRSNISRFEQENIQLSEGFLKTILEKLNFPESILKTETDITPPALYRRRDNVPVKKLVTIDANINLYQMNIKRLLNNMQWEAPKVPLLPVSETLSPENSATKLREEWKLPKGAIDNLTEVMESHGFLTVPIEFATDRVDSRSVLIDNKYPVIFYNKKLLGDRLRFTLAYELGHLVMHTRTPLIKFEDLSHEANLFAAELLMPHDEMVKDLTGDIDLDLLAGLKGKWKVSMHALLYKAHDLKLISDNQKRYIINRFNALKIRRREPKELDLVIERGKLLRDLITTYRTKQKMSIAQMADFFYLHEAEFLERYN